MWNFATQGNGQDKFRSIQSNCLKKTPGAFETASFEVLEMETAVPLVNSRLTDFAAIKSMKIKSGLNKKNLIKELSTVINKKFAIDHNMKSLSDSEILKNTC